MPVKVPKDSSLGQYLAGLFSVPAERITNMIIIAEWDTGLAMAHTMCCEIHAREGLARIAATPPDIPDVSRFTGSN